MKIELDLGNDAVLEIVYSALRRYLGDPMRGTSGTIQGIENRVLKELVDNRSLRLVAEVDLPTGALNETGKKDVARFFANKHGWDKEKKIVMIRDVRDYSGAPLQESKKLVEAVLEEHNTL